MRLTHINMAASQQWGCLTSMWLPQKNVAASQQWGCLTKFTQNNKVSISLWLNRFCSLKNWCCFIAMRLPHINELPNNNDDASQQWGCLTTVWLPQNNEAVSQQCGSLKMWLPHNNMAVSQQCGCLTTIWLPHNNFADSQQCSQCSCVGEFPC